MDQGLSHCMPQAPPVERGLPPSRVSHNLVCDASMHHSSHLGSPQGVIRIFHVSPRTSTKPKVATSFHHFIYSASAILSRRTKSRAWLNPGVWGCSSPEYRGLGAVLIGLRADCICNAACRMECSIYDPAGGKLSGGKIPDRHC